MMDDSVPYGGAGTDQPAPLAAQPSMPASPLDDLVSPEKQKKLETDLGTLQRQKIGAEAGLEAEQERRDKQYRANMQDMIAQEGAVISNIKPWNAQEQLAAHKTDLWEQFGSPGFLVAMIGSAFTRMPMNSALNAGAAAMNAINQGDMKAYDKAFDAWKENTDLVIKRLGLMHQEFADIDKLRATDLTEWERKMKVAAARFDDKATLAYMEAGMYPELYQRMAAISTARAQMETAKTAIQENDLRRRLVVSFIQNPSDWHDPQKIVKATAQAEQLMSLTKSPGTPEQQLWLEWQQQHPDASLDDQIKFYQGLKQAAYGGRLSPQSQALQEFLKEHPDANAEQISAFIQSGHAGRSALSMYMTRYLQENPLATADDIKEKAQKFSTQMVAQNRFLSGPQGNTVRSLNVVVSHLQTLQELGQDLQNGDLVAFNRVAQRFAEETGNPAPTNFDTAKQIVGAEIIKALGVAGAGTKEERQDAANDFSRSRNMEQLLGAINVARQLLTGQLSGLRRQFIASTGLEASVFDDMLEPETRSFLVSSQNRSGTTSTGVQWTVH